MNSSLISFLAYLIRNGGYSSIITSSLRSGAVTPAEVMAAKMAARKEATTT